MRGGVNQHNVVPYQLSRRNQRRTGPPRIQFPNAVIPAKAGTQLEAGEGENGPCFRRDDASRVLKLIQKRRSGRRACREPVARFITEREVPSRPELAQNPGGRRVCQSVAIW